ncbi:MAG: C39 family peptidase [Kiritimatiellaeota bacterium]|nr:C39 family peptidase [Kiritimatiellota bacterium]
MKIIGLGWIIWLALVVGSVRAQDIPAAVSNTVSPEQMNTAFGVPLWVDDNLWAQTIEDVARRLKACEESNTEKESCYRVQTDRILGVHPENMKLIGKDGKMDAVLIMFANKGDTLGMAPDQEEYAAPKEFKEALIKFQERERQLAKTIRTQGDLIEQTLKGLLGNYTKQRFGEGNKTTELVKTWHWTNHVFMLSEQKDASLSLRIVSAACAGTRGKAVQVTDTDLRAELKTRVVHRDNGDVVVTGIPMIDQGEKGYCVPTTWARFLRYMGIPADEYVLANAAQTKKGGGTSNVQMLAAVTQMVKQNRRTIKTVTGRITLNQVAKYIDNGLPIMWSMYSVGPFEDVGQSADRMGSESPEAWKQSLKTARKAAKQLKPALDRMHVCMIIGYNPRTDEIAISDSWGLRHAEKWYTLDEVQAVSQNEMFVIAW